MIIDLHCDTLSKMYNENITIDNKKLSVNKERLNKYYLLQVYALFIQNKKYNKKTLDKIINIYYDNLKDNHITKYNELLINYENNKPSSLLALEDGGYIKKIKDLHNLYNKGIRLICLTWNYENKLGYPHIINKGLKPLGIKVIKEMEKLNMIVCVSHLSDEGFYDVYNNTTKPFIASHSNCRSIHHHTRNLTDDMIIKIYQRGGLIGINYYNKFLSNNDTTTIKDIVSHINHIKSIASIDVVSLGSDFDGIDNIVEFEGYKNFTKELSEYFTDDEVDKIMYLNAAKFLKKFLI